MNKWAYYNEIDPYAAQWIRNLIKAGLVAPGEVDERSIEDVHPDDVRGFTQCHWFAGVAVWSYALRRAGWSDERPVWTGSCPCQPFSSAGKGDGVADERHLWPAWFHLISQCRPDVVFGEQVEAAIKHAWLDLVQSDLEGIGYAVGATGLPACGVGAPHIRQRLWFVGSAVANTLGAERWPSSEHRGEQAGDEQREPSGDDSGARSAVADAGGERRQQDAGSPSCNEAEDGGAGRDRGQSHLDHLAAGNGQVRVMADADTERQPATAGGGATPSQRHAEPRSLVGDAIGTGLEGHPGHGHDGDGPGRQHEAEGGPAPAPGCTNGFWSDADWLPFRDGKIRPIEPGTLPLAHGTPSTVGRLRAYGNAIVAEVAEEFIRAYLEGVKP